jgi:NAD-dependent DNA ligase
MTSYNDLSVADKCMVHRYLYYVVFRPVLTDQVYDKLEREAVESTPEDHPIHQVGSDLERSYSEEIKRIAHIIK